ncbi:MAG: ribbon-helix-helix protein, CopG family [Rubrivivax sp.]|nr:ribbon-helix-helix protein, CopG family [Rubrivivax sp.]
MSRTIIDIPAPLLHEADELCQRLGVSRAEVVRRALREFLKRNESVSTDGFGLWAHQEADNKAGADGSRKRGAERR